MVIATGKQGGDDMILLGLSEKNLEMLKAGKPMSLSAETHPGIPKWLTINIVYGKDEQAIYDMLKDAGALEGASVQKDPRL